MFERELAQVVETLWQTSLDHVPRRIAMHPQDVVLLAEPVTASVCLRGNFEGVLCLSCPKTLARDIAGQMFRLPVDEISTADVRDAIGEVVNILAGNLKAILPAPCSLSLPEVREGNPSPTGFAESETLGVVCFESQDQNFLVRLSKTWPYSVPPRA